MPRVQCGDRLQLQDHGPGDNQVRDIASNNMSLKSNIDSILLLNNEPSLAQLIGQGIFINLFQEPVPKPVGNIKSTADDQPRKLLPLIGIPLHPRNPRQRRHPQQAPPAPTKTALPKR